MGHVQIAFLELSPEKGTKHLFKPSRATAEFSIREPLARSIWDDLHEGTLVGSSATFALVYI
jgi:hypothetical protein